MSWQIVCADVLDWAEEYDGPKFHAMLCDPPYHLAPDNRGITRYNRGCKGWKEQPELYNRTKSRGFMGKTWDGGNIAFDPATWAALAQHLLPGAWVMAFASSRGWHRLAVAMEDSGLIIQPSIFGWATGQSFPKATRIDTQIDKTDARDERREREYRFTAWMQSTGITAQQINEATDSFMGSHYLTDKSQPAIATADMFDKLRPLLPKPPAWVEKYVEQRTIESKTFAEREVVGKSEGSHRMGIPLPNTYNGERQYLDITAPATDLARAWVGHRYGGQVLKDALNPIICAQKPWTNPRLDCIVETGAGALWVDGGRISGASGDGHWTRKREIGGQGIYGGGGYEDRDDGNRGHSQGRWPANFALQHDPGCQRVGVRKVKGTTWSDRHIVNQQSDGSIKFTEKSPGYRKKTYTDPDGTETVADWRCTESCPVKRLGEQSGERPGDGRRAKVRHNRQSVTSGKGIYGKFNDKDTIGYADTGTAARFFKQVSWSYEIAERLALADPVRYQAKASRRERDAGLEDLPDSLPHAAYGDFKGTPEHATNMKGKQRNPHPTVKPTALNIWLATLLLPPPEYAPRRLLVPFCGSGSEGIGGVLAGFDEITMIDSNAEYCQIAEARTRWWQGWSQQAGTTEPKEILKAGKGQPAPEGEQLELLGA